MKVRIGVAAGAGLTSDTDHFLGLVDALDDLGYDSIWVPDIVTTPTADPIAALAVAAGRRQRVKLGTHLIIPGRDPVFLAKQLATLDQLSGGRVLLMAVLGLNQPAELAAQGVFAAERTSMLEESLHIMRTLWQGDELNHVGKHHTYEGVRLAVVPNQNPLEVWLGGQVPAALRRAGRLAEGWMPGLVTPAEAAAMRTAIETEAEAAGRFIDAEHFGMNISWSDGPITDDVRAGIAARRSDLVAEDVIGVGVDGLAARINAFLEAGFSKFVIRPAQQPASWPDSVASVASILELQT